MLLLGSFHLKWTKGLNFTSSKIFKNTYVVLLVDLMYMGKNGDSSIKYHQRYNTQSSQGLLLAKLRFFVERGFKKHI